MDQAIQTNREPSFLQLSAKHLEERQELQATLEKWQSQLSWERQQREEVEQQLKAKQTKLDEMQLQIDELLEMEELGGKCTYLNMHVIVNNSSCF